MITLPIGIVKRIVDLLVDIAAMKAGYQIYETANQLSKDLFQYLQGQL